MHRVAQGVWIATAVLLASCSGGSSGAVAPVATNTQSPLFPGAGPGQPTPAPGQSVPPTPAPTASPTPPPPPPGVVTPAPAVVRLGSYRVAPQQIFVAGISSGGFFGVQMHVAHSSVFKGAAIYAGGVYHCARNSVVLALTMCGGETINGQALYQNTLAPSESYLDQQSAAATIDAASNLQGQPVYLWSGT